MKNEETQSQERPQQSERAEAPDAELDKLRQELDLVRKERDELLGRLQRVSADYANFEKRVPRQISDSVLYEKERIIRSLLPVLDNFEHTLKAHSAESTDSFVRGVEIIYSQMVDALKSQGVEQIHAQGQKFDPERHEAMMRRTEPDKPDDMVLDELQKGYAMAGRVIRPSRVVVNKVQTAQPPEPQEPQSHHESPDSTQTDAGPQEETE
jgi:molecular chaperone GrpE